MSPAARAWTPTRAAAFVSSASAWRTWASRRFSACSQMNRVPAGTPSRAMTGPYKRGTTRFGMAEDARVADVKIGLVLPTREAAMAGRPDVGPLLEFAERAEEARFSSLWVGDAPFARARFEPLSLLAAVAARTRRGKVGPAIRMPVLRH